MTHVAATDDERARAYERIREELDAGRQAFVVCPLVEESEALQARAATAEFERLRGGELKDYRVVLMHGQMRPREKQEAMAAFAAGGADVLVATTVIEVGIDVPNATVMLVEDAERYGISPAAPAARADRPRRARVGLPALRPEGLAPAAGAWREHRDGFRLAEIDLELRGEGEMLGVRQSGMQAFKFARLPEDVELLERARRWAREILDHDPELRARARADRGRDRRAPTARTRWRRSRPSPRLQRRQARRGPRRRGARRRSRPPITATKIATSTTAERERGDDRAEQPGERDTRPRRRAACRSASPPSAAGTAPCASR